MADPKPRHKEPQEENLSEESLSEEVAQNPGMRTAATNANPSISLEETRNAAAGEGPNAAGGAVTSTAENHVPSRSNPNPTNLPSTDHPVPDNLDEAETSGASHSFSEETDDRYAH